MADSFAKRVLARVEEHESAHAAAVQALYDARVVLSEAHALQDRELIAQAEAKVAECEAAVNPREDMPHDHTIIRALWDVLKEDA